MKFRLEPNQPSVSVHYKREFVITEFVITEFDCSKNIKYSYVCKFGEYWVSTHCLNICSSKMLKYNFANIEFSLIILVAIFDSPDMPNFCKDHNKWFALFF